ncbi:MAG: NAD-dependent epimerase/dehydratase family protein [Planctomycetota bacterium]
MLNVSFERVLVTGATGFVGRHLLDSLRDNDIFESIRILIRRTSDRNKIALLRKIIPDVEIVYGDLEDLASLEQAAQHCDAVINLAGAVTYENVPDLYNVNIKGVENLCRAALKQEAKKLVHISSTAALGYSKNRSELLNEDTEFTLNDKGYYYAESKYRGDKIASDYFRRDDLPVVICLPSEIYGEHGWGTARNLVDIAKCPVVWDGGTSVVYVKDVAAGIIGALCHGVPGERYILGGENLTIEEIARKILKLANKNSKVHKVPNVVMNYPIRYFSLLMQKLHFRPMLNSNVIKYATKYWFVDSSKARKDLRFKPVNSNVLFAKTVNWLKQEHLL